jgi:hypothetical protein
MDKIKALVEKITGRGGTYHKIMQKYDTDLYNEIDEAMEKEGFSLTRTLEHKGYTICKSYDPMFREFSYIVQKAFTMDPNERMYKLASF